MRNMRPFQAQQAAASSAETSLTPRRISYGFGASHRVGVNLAAVSTCALGSLHSPTQDHPIVMLLTGYNSGGERGDRGRERERKSGRDRDRGNRNRRKGMEKPNKRMLEKSWHLP